MVAGFLTRDSSPNSLVVFRVVETTLGLWDPTLLRVTLGLVHDCTTRGSYDEVIEAMGMG